MKNLMMTIASSTVLTVMLLSFIGFKSPVEKGDLPANLPESDTPVGTIAAWSGNPAFLPDNWKVCDGTQFPKESFRELYKIIADNWTPDTGASKDLFRIPDLRGLFLRGVSGTRNDSWSDPQKDDRIAFGKNSSNEVGSFQYQATKLPGNPFKTDVDIFLQGRGKGMEHGVGNPNKVTQGDYLSDGRNWKTTNTIYGGDKETRPNNAYIHWIIKVKQ
ncbi:MAG: phage tail protein [Cyclobacteriaceae bacterium]